jgi:HEAT repeat protein
VSTDGIRASGHGLSGTRPFAPWDSRGREAGSAVKAPVHRPLGGGTVAPVHAPTRNPKPGSVGVTRATIRKLGKRRDVASLLALLGATEVRESTKLRKAILMSLEPLQDRAATRAMTGLVKADPDRGVRVLAMWVLRGLVDRTSIDFLVDVLEHSGDKRIRIYAGDALANTGADEGLRALVKALDDRSATVRIAAARNLAQLGDLSAGPAIEAAIHRTGNPYQRWLLSLKLGQLKRLS